MQLSEAIRKRILDLLNENNMTLHKLSLCSGIPYSTLNSFINNKSNSPTIDTILHICEGLNIELSFFFSDKIFKDVNSD